MTGHAGAEAVGPDRQGANFDSVRSGRTSRVLEAVVRACLGKWEQQIEQIAQLPKARQRFVSQVLDPRARLRCTLRAADAGAPERHLADDHRQQRREQPGHAHLCGFQYQRDRLPGDAGRAGGDEPRWGAGLTAQVGSNSRQRTQPLRQSPRQPRPTRQGGEALSFCIADIQAVHDWLVAEWAYFLFATSSFMNARMFFMEASFSPYSR